jgi:hypothetical protein
MDSLARVTQQKINSIFVSENLSNLEVRFSDNSCKGVNKQWVKFHRTYTSDYKASCWTRASLKRQIINIYICIYIYFFILKRLINIFKKATEYTVTRKTYKQLQAVFCRYNFVSSSRASRLWQCYCEYTSTLTIRRISTIQPVTSWIVGDSNDIYSKSDDSELLNVILFSSLVATRFKERLSVNKRETRKYDRGYVNSGRLNRPVTTFSVASDTTLFTSGCDRISYKPLLKEIDWQK